MAASKAHFLLQCSGLYTESHRKWGFQVLPHTLESGKVYMPSNEYGCKSLNGHGGAVENIEVCQKEKGPANQKLRMRRATS